MAPTNPSSGPPPAPNLGSGSFAPVRPPPGRGPPGTHPRPAVGLGMGVGGTAAASASARALMTTYNPPDDDDSEDDISDEEPTSLITLEINTPLHIRGEGNLIAIEPSVTANRIAMGMVQALQQMRLEHGFSMTDEEGRPRPITIKVTAGTVVEGSKNLVGERAVMQRIAPELATKGNQQVTSLNLGQALKKRERERARAADEESESEEAAKRTRRA
ncbi:hypothetical protein LZ554_005043 [Drepanopeziza brunnea f. sp. 'monogermtubi']|nr:hypothetical protein LZ554_005043 [Drepanopeziza brunnea f. sp. 'monogermtubi']